METTRLFLMTVREGVTDSQISDALRQGLPDLTDPTSLLQDRHAGKETEVPSSRRLEQDLGDWQDDHPEKDVEESITIFPYFINDNLI